MVMVKRKYENSKQTILDAALKVIAKDGSKGLSTNEVIKESGLSKAGFFYNFKTKNDLLIALYETLITEWKTLVEKYKQEDENPFGRSMRAYVKATLKQFKEDDPSRQALYLAITELAHADTDFMSKYIEDFRSYSPLGENEGLSEGKELLIMFTLEGLFSQVVVPTIPLNNDQLDRVFDGLIQMTEGRMEIKTEAEEE